LNLNNKSPEYLSLFIDEKLKKGAKGVSSVNGPQENTLFDILISRFNNKN